MKKNLLFFLILLLSLNLALCKSYSLERANVHIKVLNNGLVNVEEEITYSFNGCYNEIYRSIPLYSESSIIGMIGCSNESFNPIKDFNSDYYSYIFKFDNEQCNKITTIVLDYNMSGVVDVYNDVNGLHFQFWGSEGQELNELNAVIELNGGIIDYWIHNSVPSECVKVNNNILIYNASKIPANHWIETQLISERFTSESAYWDVHNETGGSVIKQRELFYSIREKCKVFAAFFIIISPLIAFYYIYDKYGRELKIDYIKGYERNPPTNDSPALVNAILNSPNSGEPNLDAFLATLFDLARRGYLKIKQGKMVNNSFLGLGGAERDTIIEFVEKGSIDLMDYELLVYKFLKKYSNNGELSWIKMQKNLKKYDESRKFQKKLNKFKKLVKDKFEKKDYFNTEGNVNYLLISGVLLLINGVILGLFSVDNVITILPLLIYIPIFLTMIFTKSKAKWFMLIFILLHMSGFFINVVIDSDSLILKAFIISFLINLVCNCISKEVLGKWTRKGKYFELQWENFKKFLKDYSLLNQHPPESIVIWEKFLVYAVSLNVADNVLKVMKLIIRDYPKNRSMSGVYYHPGFYSSMRTSLFTSSTRSRSNSGSSGFGGGGGGFGGGHGGGGGGAR